ncbi:MAG TPA: hypothetical protein VFX33_03050 [Actinomycetales bacterium]|nr:hypothetical protein [Actinomycetales bacterium]
MSTPTLDVRPSRRARKPHGWAFYLLLGLGGLVVGVLVIAALWLVAAVGPNGRDVPQFPSLATTPDPSLHGTVAYMADDGCVWIVAAAGRPSKEVYCIPPMDVSKAEKLGKELGPQLVWLPGGRLEVTMFRMTNPPGPGFNPGWQRIVDVRTGAVQEVPASQVPSEPNRQTHPTVNAQGQKLTWTTTDNGRIEVKLTDSAGTRTLLKAQGPGEMTYRLGAVFWEPDGRWVAADDGRILIITPDDPAVTRVLTSNASDGAFDAELSRFALTSEDVLTG